MHHAPQTAPNRHIPPAVVIVLTGLLLLLAALCVLAVVRGSWRWPWPALAAVIFVITAQGVWRLREWARWTATFLLGLSLFVVPLSVMSYWWGADHTADRGCVGHRLRLSAARAAGPLTILVPL